MKDSQIYLRHIRQIVSLSARKQAAGASAAKFYLNAYARALSEESPEKTQAEADVEAQATFDVMIKDTALASMSIKVNEDPLAP